MSGSLKVVCATGQTKYLSTPTFATLNAQMAFTVSGWFQIASASPSNIAADLMAAFTTGMAGFGTGGPSAFSYSAKSAVPTSITAAPAIDANGHFVVIAYDGDFASTIYVDGAPIATAAGLGRTDAVDQAILLGYDQGGPAVTIYFKDLAIWGGYAATQQDVLDLRDGTSTPATLATPAAHWWTLQGPSGAVTAGTQGLADSIGAVNLGTLTGSGTLSYDAHEIVLSHPVLMMPPYVDITGNLVFIPLYLNPDITAGGPATPSAVNVAPIFELNGSVVTPDPLAVNVALYALVYQMPSGTSVGSGDTLTMSAPMGWASATAGLVAGTSPDGTLATPLVVTNNAGQTVESIYNVAKTIKVGYNTPPFSPAPNANGQPRANWASRLSSASWSGVNSFDPTTQIPDSITGQGVGVLMYSINNGVDANGSPSTEGLYTLVYGDSSAGVTSNPTTGHVLNARLAAQASWNFVETIVSPGTWDGTAWRGITKTYQASYKGSGNYGIGLSLTIDSAQGAGTFPVAFPSKGNGQVELGVFPPSPANRNVSSATNWDPLGVDPEYLLKHQGAAALRWMADAGANTGYGDSTMRVVADLVQRQVNDFLWTKHATVTSNIIKAEPIGATFDVLVDYQASPVTMSAANWHDAGLAQRVPMLCTTNAPHGLQTGGRCTITGTTAAPATKIDHTGNLLTAAITTTGQTMISVTATTGQLATLVVQIDSEQMAIVSVDSPTQLTVTRAVNGTSAATHLPGATVYPCIAVIDQSQPCFVISPTTFVIGPYNQSLPGSGATSLTNPTLAGTVNYTAPNCPVVTVTTPEVSGSVPYEFAVKFTSDIAAAKGSETICWLNFSVFSADDLVTAVFRDVAAPYAVANPHLTFIAELSNELWIGNQNGVAAGLLSLTAPNPEGPPYSGLGEFTASRQHHITGLAKAAFTAAGLDPARVYNFQPGHRQYGLSQGDTSVIVIYCQRHSFPIDYLPMDGYVDITADVWDLWWSWRPVADGGAASWNRGIWRRMMMSYFRAWCWFSAYLGSAIAGTGQLLSWYKAGKSVADRGVGDATANTGLGRICYYEAATELTFDASSSFVNPFAEIHDLVNDGIPQWAGDTGWKATEEAYWAAKQGAGAMYAALMPVASAPDLPSFTAAFSCYYASVYQYGGQGQAWLLYNWQGHQPGDGATNTMGWDAAAPVATDRLNQSIRAQVALDWIGAPIAPAAATAAPAEAGDRLATAATAGPHGTDSAGSAAAAERRDTLTGRSLATYASLAVTEARGRLAGTATAASLAALGLIHPELVSFASYGIDPTQASLAPSGIDPTLTTFASYGIDPTQTTEALS